MLPRALTGRLRLPVIAAPMTGVSGPDLVIAACQAGVIGSFPTHNARTVDDLDRWLTRITGSLGTTSAPVAPNLVVHRSNHRLDADVDCLVRHGVELVITSVGSPRAVVDPLHAAGCLVFADVATMRHADRALDTGVDGLVLLTAGAGGQTGWHNPFAFVRAVRQKFDGPLVLAGGGADGAAVAAAQVLGADLVYLGTRFIATRESLAADVYRAALVDASLDDVIQTSAPSGLPANFLTRSLPDDTASPARSGFDLDAITNGNGAWPAGHTAHLVTEVLGAADLVEQTRAEYLETLRSLTEKAAPAGKDS